MTPEKLSPTDPVPVTLGDGVTRHLRYSLGSMKRLKKKLGVSMLSPDGLKGMDEDKLTDLLWEGLVEKDGLTLEDMADLIDARELGTLIGAFSLAFSGSLPEKNATSQTVQ